MFALIYRLANAPWNQTNNPAIVDKWYEMGEVVEVIADGVIINTYFKEG